MIYNDNICFKKGDLKLYVFLLICVFIFIFYILSKKLEKMTDVDLDSHLSQKELIKKIMNLQDSLYKVELQKQNCERNYQQLQLKEQEQEQAPITSLFLNKIYNPISPPENLYRDQYNSYQKYQQVGFLTNKKDGQFPVFARDKYPNKSDKQEYYTINEGRNHVKIPFKTKNYNELFDDDEIMVPELSNDPFIFKKYDTQGMRYNPNAL
jgi:hypothetical protein